MVPQALSHKIDYYTNPTSPVYTFPWNSDEKKSITVVIGLNIVAIIFIIIVIVLITMILVMKMKTCLVMIQQMGWIDEVIWS